MNRTLFTAATAFAALIGLLLFTGEQAAETPRPGTYPFAFSDASDAAGLFPNAANIWGHGAAKGVNRMGIGSRANLYAEGKLGQAAALLGCREIATGYGYASGQPTCAHFGLGQEQKVDVEVILPHGKGKLTHKGVAANQVLKVKQ